MGGKISTKKHNVDALFAFALYVVFVFLSLLVVLAGAQVYTRIVNDSQTRNDVRSATFYVVNKIRATDTVCDDGGSGGLRLKSYESTNVLVLNKDEDVELLIYEYDGYLMELWQFTEDPFIPSYGMKILAIKNFYIAENNGMFTIAFTDKNGNEHTTHISRRT